MKAHNTHSVQRMAKRNALVAMIDPPRAEVAEAIALCHQAGIAVTMVTGNYGLTTEAIAGMAGFFLIWWSHGYAIADLQRITPAILAHTADLTVTAIYHQATTMILTAIVACQVGNILLADSIALLFSKSTGSAIAWCGVESPLN